jgi:hypothetical protein
MDGRIAAPDRRLAVRDHQRRGWADYTFTNVSLIDATFGDLYLGAAVSFIPIIGPAQALRAESVRLISERKPPKASAFVRQNIQSPHGSTAHV